MNTPPFRLGGHPCPKCEHPITVDPKYDVRPGDVTICERCAALLLLGEDLEPWIPSPADKVRILNGPAGPRFREIQEAIRRDIALRKELGMPPPWAASGGEGGAP